MYRSGHLRAGPAEEAVNPDDVVAALRAAGCVFAEDEAALLLAAPGPLQPLLARRIAGEPLEQVMEACGWNMARAARRLGVNRSTVLRRLRAAGLRSCMRFMERSKVLFPQPEGPINAVTFCG